LDIISCRLNFQQLVQ
jgi:hypothetical protein